MSDRRKDNAGSQSHSKPEAWQLDFKTACKDYPGVAESAEALVRAGADPKELSRLFLFIAVAADLLASYDRAEAKRLRKISSDANRLLLRVPGCLRAAADAVVEAARIFDDEEVAYQTEKVQPLRSTATYVESHLVRYVRAKPDRLDRPLRLAQIRLLDYIREATKKSRYKHVAALVSGALTLGGLLKEGVDASELRDLKRKNPGLKSRLRFSWPRRHFLEKLTKRNPPLKPCLKSYPHP